MAWLGRAQPHPEVEGTAWKPIDISRKVVAIVVSALGHELLCVCICMPVEHVQYHSEPQTLVNPCEICIRYMHVYMNTHILLASLSDHE